MKCTISAGHTRVSRGAVGLIDEWEEACRVRDEVVRLTGAHRVVDDVTTTANDNLVYVVNAHNGTTRAYDVSIHFNASSVTTTRPIGVEVLYYSDQALARKMSAAISEAGGLIDRGAKQRQELYFLRHTTRPAILIEVCFVNSKEDVMRYRQNFAAICRAIARVLAPMPALTEKAYALYQNEALRRRLVTAGSEAGAFLPVWQTRTLTYEQFCELATLAYFHPRP